MNKAVKVLIEVMIVFDDDHCDTCCEGKGVDYTDEDMCYFFGQAKLFFKDGKYKRCPQCLEATKV